jgi:hypothetical protein
MPVANADFRDNVGTCRAPGLCFLFLLISLALTAGGCAPAPIVPDDADTIATVFDDASSLQATDGRARFRKIFCAVNADHGQALPDFRPCEEALRKVSPEPFADEGIISPSDQQPLLRIYFVQGFGADCFAPMLDDDDPVSQHLGALGHSVEVVPIEGLASTERNARVIRDSVLAAASESTGKPVVLFGYSKGVADILDALTTYPELTQRVSAVVSLAGAVGGSPLAVDASQWQASLLAKIPGSGCDESDGGSINAMLPEVRRDWLANHLLPNSVRYYSILAMPEPDKVSKILKATYNKLGKIDYRNDSQILFSDQIIPGSTILGFLNADHWAVAVPIARSRPLVAKSMVNHNEFPREVLNEAIVRLIQQDLY